MKFKTKELTLGAIIIAMYIALTGMFASLSFGAIQIRISNILYGLANPFPFLVLPLTLSVMLSNLVFGGLGLVDIICGGITAFLVTLIISKCKKTWMIILVIIIGVPLGIATYLSKLIYVPFLMLFLQIMLGQIIPAVLSYIIVRKIKGE